MASIIPTVSRKVWYHPLPHERFADGKQPLDATICHVHSDVLVNLQVNNEFGNPMPGKTSVKLLPSYADTIPGECSWMPFQVGQAQKTEAAEAAAAAAQQQAAPHHPV